MCLHTHTRRLLRALWLSSGLLLGALLASGQAQVPTKFLDKNIYAYYDFDSN